MLAIFNSIDRPDLSKAAFLVPIPEEEYVERLCNMEARHMGRITERDCQIDSLRNTLVPLDCLHGQFVNLDELDFLAGELANLPAGALKRYAQEREKHDYTGITDLINLALIIAEKPELPDYSQLERIAHDENIVLYQGRSFPPHSYMKFMIRMKIYAEPQKNRAAAFLDMPMRQQKLERMLMRSGIPDEATLNAVYQNFDFPLSIFDRNALYLSKTKPSELNALCAALRSQSTVYLNNFDAVLEYAKPHGAEQIRRLVENLDQFEFFPNIKDATEYGKHLIRSFGCFENDEALADYYNYSKLGEDRLNQQAGGFVRAGLVIYRGEGSIEELLTGADQHQDMGMEGLQC